MICRAFAGLVVLFGGCGVAWAQSVPPGRVEVGGGVTWLGSASSGSIDATESTSTGGVSTIFKTSTMLASAVGFRLHAAFRVTRTLEIEGQTSFSKPSLESTISNDIENAASVVAAETIKHYVIGGGVLWYVPLRTARLKPFVAGQIVYLRQLHEGDTLAVTGHSYQVGGGVKYFVTLQRKSWIKGYGVRGDIGVAARVKGVFFDDATRLSPAVAASLFARF